jgi:hypothetical protein
VLLAHIEDAQRGEVVIVVRGFEQQALALAHSQPDWQPARILLPMTAMGLRCAWIDPLGMGRVTEMALALAERSWKRAHGHWRCAADGSSVGWTGASLAAACSRHVPT